MTQGRVPARLAVCLALIAGPAAVTAADNDLRLGHALYTGSAAPGVTLPDAHRPCAACHARDGRGGEEGDVPAILWDDLTRRGYDGESFHRALTRGTGPNGRHFSRLMPRADLTERETAALADYLSVLPERQSRGVKSDGVTFCTSADAPSYTAALSRALAARMEPDGLYGRRVEIADIALSGPEETDTAETACLAVIGPIPGGAALQRALSDRGVPVLFALATLVGNEDPSLRRDLKPSRRNVLTHLAQALIAAGAKRVRIRPLDHPDAAILAQAIRLSPGGKAVTVMDDEGQPTDLVLLSAPEGPVPADVRVWIGTEHLRGLPRSDTPLDVRAVVAAPNLAWLARSTGLPAEAVHAGVAAALLVEALTIARRDVTRAGLLRAFDEIRAPDLGLDYTRTPLTGTEEVLILDLSAPFR